MSHPWLLRDLGELENAWEELRAAEAQLVQAQDEREAERARYFDLFDHAPDGYFVTNSHGSIREANRAAAAMLNMPERLVRFLVRKPLAVFIESSDHAAFYSAIAHLRREERGRWILRLRPRGQRASIITEASAALQHDPRSGEPIIRWAIRDVTDQVRARQELDQNHKRLRALASELSMAEERERRRLATGIHDRISQGLAVAKMLIGDIQKHAVPEQHSALRELRGVIEQTIGESRTLTFEISPPMLYQLGLGAAVSWLAEQMRRRHGIDVRVIDRIADPQEIPVETRVLMFQAVRELLVNVVKHAHASLADVVMSHELGTSTLEVKVSDNGRGYDARRSITPGHEGFGLFNLQTRFEQIGAQFLIDTQPKRGTRVTMITRMRPPAADEEQVTPDTEVNRHV